MQTEVFAGGRTLFWLFSTRDPRTASRANGLLNYNPLGNYSSHRIAAASGVRHHLGDGYFCLCAISAARGISRQRPVESHLSTIDRGVSTP
jgi:hypothetical protein